MEYLNLALNTLISVVIAWIFYRLELKPVRLSFKSRSIQLIGHNAALPSEVEFFFSGKKIPSVARAVVMVWNSGTKTVNGDAIVEKDYLRIVTGKGSEILKVMSVKTTRHVIEFSADLINDHPNEIKCNFDFLDPKDGALIEFFHTGDDKLSILGTVRGMPKGLSNRGCLQLTPKSRREIFWLSFITVILGVLVVLLIKQGILVIVQERNFIAGLLSLFFGFAFTVFLMDATKEIRRHIFMRRFFFNLNDSSKGVFETH